MPRTIARSLLSRRAGPATADVGTEKMAASKQPKADVSRATVRMGPHLWTGGSPELRVDIDSEPVRAGRCYRMRSLAACDPISALRRNPPTPLDEFLLATRGFVRHLTIMPRKDRVRRIRDRLRELYGRPVAPPHGH